MPITNLDFLKTFTKGDTSKMKKYIEMYLQTGGEKVTTMQTSLAQKEYEVLKVAAHTMKSQSRYMGITSVEDDIVRIERYCNEHVNLEQLPELVTRVSNTLSGSFTELSETLKNMS